MTTNTANASQQDLSSILSQVKGLEEEKTKLMQLLESERERLKEVSARAEKMSEGKRTEMKQALDTVIMNWLQEAVKDEKIREEFKAGMSRLADDAKDDAGVWQVVCCASNLHAERLKEIERIRGENEELKSRGVGDFRDESSRKRGREEVEGGAGGASKQQDSNIWVQFEQEMSSGRSFGLAGI